MFPLFDKLCPGGGAPADLSVSSTAKSHCALARPRLPGFPLAAESHTLKLCADSSVCTSEAKTFKQVGFVMVMDAASWTCP